MIGHYLGKAWKQARAVYDGGGLSPTLTAVMGGHGNNFVWVDLTTCGKENNE